VRWDNLRVEAEEEHRLPGYREPAVVRTFDAPEALDTRFYEIRARSALNRVPKKSRMPFRWTINPYRGCAHACRFCQWGGTPILMGDGRTKPLAEVRPGDRVYGTIHDGRYRRYVITEVLDHWETFKPGYRITLEDGTELIASGDHRFLTPQRGWKHVTNNQSGVDRAHLTTNNSLMGTGQFAEGPVKSAEYERGYLCGLIRGDGHLSSSPPRFRLALADFEALRRGQRYLEDLDLETREFQFQAAVGDFREIRAIATGAGAAVTSIHHWVRWPDRPGLDWCRGFLAGIFDAEGCYSGSLRISNTDSQIIERTSDCLGRLGFKYTVEDYDRPNGLRCVRLLGGLAEALRFFHKVDPAITRKRAIEGAMVKTFGNLRVASIEPLGGKMILFDITTGTGDFIANGVVSHNCFARPTHTYLDFDAGRDFEREIVVKVNAPELVRAELSRPSWKIVLVAMGTDTDY